MSSPLRPVCPPVVAYSADCNGAIPLKVVLFSNVTTMDNECGTPVGVFERYEAHQTVCAITALWTDCAICDENGEIKPADNNEDGHYHHCRSVISNEAVRESLPDDSEPGETYPKTEIRNGNTFYSADGAKMDKSCLNRMGFKNVQSFKAWHGRYGFEHTSAGVDVSYPLKFYDPTDEEFKKPTKATIDAAPEWVAMTAATRGDYYYIGSTYYFAIVDNTDFDPTTNPDKWAKGLDNLAEVKYLTATIHGQFKFGQYDPLYPNDPAHVTLNFDVEWDAVVTVHRLSGEIELTSNIFTVNYGSIPDIYKDAFENGDYGGFGLSSLIGMLGVYNAAQYDAAWNTNNYDQVEADYSHTNTHQERHWRIAATPYDYSEMWIDVDLSDPYHLSHHATEPSVMDDTKELLKQWRLADNSTNIAAGHLYEWRADEYVFLAPLMTRDEKAASKPDDMGAIYVNDYNNPLLDGEGDDIDDGGAWTPTWGRRSWFDTAVKKWLYDPPANADEAAANELIQTGYYLGSIKGAPMPYGYERTFNYFHENWERGFCSASPDYWADRHMTTGALTPYVLPPQTTRWTADELFSDLETTINLWPCAFMLASNAGLYSQKFVETLITKPSYDFTRPHTADRFAFDETKCYCVTDLTGNKATVKEYNVSDDMQTPAGIPGIGSGLWGGASVGGFFKNCTYNAGTGEVTLTTKVFDVPTTWKSASGDTDTVFGKLRWETDGHIVPGFSGKLTVTVPAAVTYDAGAEYDFGAYVTDGTSNYVSLQSGNVGNLLDDEDWWVGGTRFNYAPSPYIADGDKIDIWNGTAWVGVGSTLRRISDTAGYVGAGWDNAKYIVPHKYYVDDPAEAPGTKLSGKKWYFADTQPKGDYLVRQWTAFGENPQGIVFTSEAAQRALPFKPCPPRVAGFSPNVNKEIQTEWASGTTYAKGDSVAKDAIYYVSKVDSNIGNDPETDNGTNWKRDVSDSGWLWYNAKIEKFPTSIDNGSVWLGQVEQHIVDPFWQIPHRRCGLERQVNGLGFATVHRWLMDDGTCRKELPCGSSGTTVYVCHYYPLPDFYEARLSPPKWKPNGENEETAPTPPVELDALRVEWDGTSSFGGIYVKDDVEPPDQARTPFDPYAAYLSGKYYSGNLGFGFNGGLTDSCPTAVTPWGIYLRQQSCVCGSPQGQFYEQYKANRVEC